MFARRTRGVGASLFENGLRVGELHALLAQSGLTSSTRSLSGLPGGTVGANTPAVERSAASVKLNFEFGSSTF
jgi:hypothetical protein